MPDQEAELIRQAQAGDRDAFAELYDCHQQSIYIFIYYRVSDRAITDELTAAVFVRMVEKIGQYRHRGRPFVAWLYTIARNLLADHYRQRGRATLVDLDETVAATGAGPADVAERQLSADCLRRALQHLTEAQRDVIVGKFVEDRSNSEMATILGKNEGSVKSLQHRALGALRRAIEIEGCYER